jgi:hypothetical protein
MMAPENMSIQMLSTYNSKYVLVFVTLQLGLSSDQTQISSTNFGGYGDEGKWVWMARISGNAATRLTQEGYMNEQLTWSNETNFGNTTQSTSGSVFTYNDLGLNSTIYKLMSYAEQQYASAYGLTNNNQVADTPSYFTPVYLAGLELTPTDSAKYGLLVPLVCLYQIDYDAYNAATPTQPYLSRLKVK